MDFINRALGLSRLGELKRVQLVAQQTTDDLLKSLIPGCDTIVAHLLLDMRSKSRAEQYGIINANIIDTGTEIEREIKNSIQFYNRINTICSKDFTDTQKCQAITRLL